MENQHRQIKGYRELSQEDINLMNEIKAKGAEIGELVDTLANSAGQSGYPDQRWVDIGRDHLQQGFMALVRSIAKPDFF